MQEDGAGIVSIGSVLWARISEAHNQFQRTAWHSNYLAGSGD